MSKSTFDDVEIDHTIIDNACYVNAEQLVFHLRRAVQTAVDSVVHTSEQGLLDNYTFIMAESAISGMAGIGMWLEDCVIEATAEKFREALDKEWPSL